MADLGERVDQMLARRAQIERAHQVEDFNATCPQCEKEILDALTRAANDWGGYGPPGHVAFECPHCGAVLQYHLEWVTNLHRATLEEDHDSDR